MDTSYFRHIMTKRVAGVPLGIFAALFVGVLGYLIWRRRQNTAAPTDVPTAADTSPTGDSTDPSLDNPTFQALPEISSNTPVVVSQATNDTNDLWARRTIEWLMKNGYTVEIATNSIQKYLNGEALNVKESEARDKAISQFGLPPESLPDVITKSPNPTKRLSDAPASKQGEPPLNHEVKGKNDDTPSELAVLYYGTNSADATNKLKAANDTLVYPYATGTKVHIPANYIPRYYRATSATHNLYDIAKKNGVPPAKVEQLNPGEKFPVPVGTRVRVH